MASRDLHRGCPHSVGDVMGPRVRFALHSVTLEKITHLVALERVSYLDNWGPGRWPNAPTGNQSESCTMNLSHILCVMQWHVRIILTKTRFEISQDIFLPAFSSHPLCGKAVYVLKCRFRDSSTLRRRRLSFSTNFAQHVFVGTAGSLMKEEGASNLHCPWHLRIVSTRQYLRDVLRVAKLLWNLRIGCPSKKEERETFLEKFRTGDRYRGGTNVTRLTRKMKPR